MARPDRQQQNPVISLSSDWPPLLTPDQLAALLHKDTHTIKRWRMLGQGPKFTLVMAEVRYPRQEVEAWLNSAGLHANTQQSNLVREERRSARVAPLYVPSREKPRRRQHRGRG